MNKILGVDFDETLFLHSYPDNYSEPNWSVINYVKRRQAEGWYIILVTCRTDVEHINGAVDAAMNVGIHFDAINENHPSLIEQWGDCRKIYCDEYIDDKNITIRDVSPTTVCVPGNRKTGIVYIAGKMRGLKDYGRQHFEDAAKRLEAAGFIVLNPASLPVGMPNYKYMPICLSMLEAADYIYMLDNWEDSEGANIEYRFARCQGKQVLFEKDESVERMYYGLKEDTEGNRTL